MKHTKSEGLLKNTMLFYQQKEQTNVFGECNKALLNGIIEDEFTFSHENDWEKFYTTRVVIERCSGVKDYVPILVSTLHMVHFPKGELKGKYVEVAGDFRAYPKWSKSDNSQEVKKHLSTFLYVRMINFFDIKDDLCGDFNANEIYLKGTIKRRPTYRVTPKGRIISDFMIKVQRKYNMFDCIPCIAWGGIAKYISNLKPGTEIEVFGRIQSREYFKRVSPESEEGETKVTYEVSVNRMKES